MLGSGLIIPLVVLLGIHCRVNGQEIGCQCVKGVNVTCFEPVASACTWNLSQPNVYTRATGAPATFSVSVAGEVLTTADRVTWKLDGTDLSVGRYSSAGVVVETLSNPRGNQSSSRGNHNLTIRSVTLSDNGQQVTVISGGCTVNDVSPAITLDVKCCNLTFYANANASDASCCGYNCSRRFTLNSDGTDFNATCLENATWDPTVPPTSTTPSSTGIVPTTTTTQNGTDLNETSSGPGFPWWGILLIVVGTVGVIVVVTVLIVKNK